MRNDSYGGSVDRAEYRFTSPPGTNLFIQLLSFTSTNNSELAIYSGIFVAEGHDAPMQQEYRGIYHPGLDLVDSITGGFAFSILSDKAIVVITQPWGEDVDTAFIVTAYEGMKGPTCLILYRKLMLTLTTFEFC